MMNLATKNIKNGISINGYLKYMMDNVTYINIRTVCTKYE